MFAMRGWRLLKKYMIHATAEIEKGASIGEGTDIWHYCHVRAGAIIGDNCSLGRNVYIDTGVVLGYGTRVQNNVSIYNGVIIGNYCFIGPHVTFTNDKYPRAYAVPGGWKIVPTRVRDHASIGAGAVVVCGYSIGRFAMIAAGAVVCRDIADYELVAEYSKHLGAVDKDGRPVKYVFPPDGAN